MKVLIIGNYAPDRQHSMQGFANALYSGLCGRGIKARLVAPSEIAGRLRVPKVGKWLGYVDKYLAFPPQLLREMRDADIIHICDHSNSVYTKYMRGKPHLVTCHDLLAVRSALGELAEQQTGFTGRTLQRMILNGLVRARYIACDSETTRQDILRLARAPAARVGLIYLGLLHPGDPMPESQSAALLQALNIEKGERFLLHVGGNQFYKNRMGLLQIYKALTERANFPPMRLVMAGKPFAAEMRSYVQEQGLANQVVELADLDDEQLRALYSRAAALIFPSLYEGFGLPIIEAQSCGCPVFTSNRAPMTEVGGDGAVYFDPAQPAQAAQVIADGLPALKMMREAGFQNVKRFTTEQMLDAYIELYTRLLAPVSA